MNFENPDLNYHFSLSEHPHPIHRHIHDLYEMIFFKNGHVSYLIDGQKYELNRNDLIFTRPLRYHLLEIEPDCVYERYVLQFDETLIGKDLLARIPEQLEVINCPENTLVAQNFVRMEHFRKELNDTDFRDILLCLTKEIIYTLAIPNDSSMQIPSMLPQVLQEALHYIDLNFASEIRIEDICQKLFISPSYFFKLFKKVLKLSPKQYINMKRLCYARKLIKSGIKPTKVFQQCGFETYVGFYKQYVNHFGHPPSQEL